MYYIHNIDPVAVDFGILQIRWYSLSYLCGIFIAYYIIKNKVIFSTQLSQKMVVDSLLSSVMLGIILGGRLGYILVYNLSYYLENPLEILKIYNGGMSFHGGVSGLMIGCLYVARKYKIPFLKITDTMALTAPLGLFFGRIANFVNQELYGMPTNGSWGVIFTNVDSLARHPSQLYEALLEGVVLGLLVFISYKYKKSTVGFTSSVFLIAYSVCRFLVEYIRVPDGQIGYIYNLITMGQILSILTIVITIISVIWIKRITL